MEAAVGFVLHSLLLVPYFSWQRSHAVHHANCNHLEGGQTHVPPRAGSALGQVVQRWATGLGPMVYGVFSLVTRLLLGEDHGTPTSHFWHGAPFRNGRRVLFPDSSRRGCCIPISDWC